MSQLSLFIFRRDLRLHDNTALMQALKESDEVIPAFFLDPRQISSKNKYRSLFAMRFLQESLLELDKELQTKDSQLYVFYGEVDKNLQKLLKEKPIQAVYVNEDYTPFSQKRDQKLKEICQKNNVDFYSYFDLLLNPPDAIKTQDGSPYKVFSAFKRKAEEYKVNSPQKNTGKNYFKGKFKSNLSATEIKKHFVEAKNIKLSIPIGRSGAKQILKNIKPFKNYKDTRNLLAEDATSHLSAHHKFGTVSIREVYHLFKSHFGKSHTFISELYWRDFFTHIAYYFPYVFGGSFHKKYDKIKWNTSKADFKKWCQGKTGFPVVDAGMRELNETGFMHNRARMITASFLVKDLLIDWRWGEQYFAQKLVDYDPSVNNGNWQWAASTGCDAQPYFRIFNPLLQQKKYDPESKYIKKWIPELESSNYPKPMLDHKEAASHTKEVFKAVKD